MEITVNAKPETFDADQLNIKELLEKKEVAVNRVAVQLNGEIIRKSDFKTTVLKDGDTVNFLHFVGGG